MARRHHKPPPRRHKKKKSDKGIPWGQPGSDNDADNPHTGDSGDHDHDQHHHGTRASESAVVAAPDTSGVAFTTGAGTLFGQGQAVGYGNPSIYSSDPGDPVLHYHQQPVYVEEVAATTTPATVDAGATVNTGNTPATPSTGSAP